MASNYAQCLLGSIFQKDNYLIHPDNFFGISVSLTTSLNDSSFIAPLSHTFSISMVSYALEATQIKGFLS